MKDIIIIIIMNCKARLKFFFFFLKKTLHSTHLISMADSGLISVHSCSEAKIIGGFIPWWPKLSLVDEIELEKKIRAIYSKDNLIYMCCIYMRWIESSVLSQ